MVAFDGEDRGTPALHALEPVMEVEKFGAQAGITIAPVKKCPMATGPRGFPEKVHVASISLSPKSDDPCATPRPRAVPPRAAASVRL